MDIPDSLPTKQAFSLLEEFKNFAFKGNVVDLAVGVIIGGAFGKIVDSMVKDLVMPLVNLITGGQIEKSLGDRLNPKNTHVFLCGNPKMIGVTEKDPATGARSFSGLREFALPTCGCDESGAGVPYAQAMR